MLFLGQILKQDGYKAFTDNFICYNLDLGIEENEETFYKKIFKNNSY